MKIGVAMTDVLTGLYATTAILAALAHRERQRQGQHIDLALLDCRWRCLANQAMNYLIVRRRPQRMGNAHPNIVPYQDFPTKDGDMIMAVGNDGQFGRLCAAFGTSGMGRGPALCDQSGTGRKPRDPDRALSEVSCTRTTAEWVATLETAGVPVRSDKHHRRRLRRSPGTGARDPTRNAARRGWRRSARRQPRPPV